MLEDIKNGNAESAVQLTVPFNLREHAHNHGKSKIGEQKLDE